MRIIAISRVRNEVDVVEAFVRHTAAHVDRHLVVDNGSSDGTDDILRSLSVEGLDLDLRSDPVPGAGPVQAAVMTEMMHRACGEAGSDGWVIPVDVDEFIVTDPGVSLHEVAAMRHDPFLVRWTTYVPSEGDSETVNPVERLDHRLRVEGKVWKKVVVPARVGRHAHLRVGNHGLDVDGEQISGLETIDEVRLAHFPIRSPEQYAVKVAQGYLGYMASIRDRGDMGFHYDEAYRLLKRDWESFRVLHRDAAVRFALRPDVDFEPELICDPIEYAGGPLRHTAERLAALRGEPLQSILEYAESLARRALDLSESLERAAAEGGPGEVAAR